MRVSAIGFVIVIKGLEIYQYFCINHRNAHAPFCCWAFLNILILLNICSVDNDYRSTLGVPDQGSTLDVPDRGYY